MSAVADALAAILAEHRYPGEMLFIFDEAWFDCACGERIDLPVRNHKVSKAEAAALFERHVANALATAVGA